MNVEMQYISCQIVDLEFCVRMKIVDRNRHSGQEYRLKVLGKGVTRDRINHSPARLV